MITLPTFLRILAGPFAVLAPMNALIATAADMPTDATAWLVVALVAVLVVIVATAAIRRREARNRRREARNRRWLSEYRAQWFASFERRRAARGVRP